MNTEAEVVSPFVRAVKRQTAVVILGGIVFGVLLLGTNVASLRSSRSSRSAADAASSTGRDVKVLLEVVAALVDPEGPSAKALRAKDEADKATAAEDRAKIIAAVNDAIGKATTLILKNEELSRRLAASETARRVDAVSAAKQADRDRALLVELGARLSALQRPVTPSSPTTTLPPPSAGLCAALPLLAPVLGCR